MNPAIVLPALTSILALVFAIALFDQWRERRGGFRGFVGESIGELKKVEWPGKHQLFAATVVVIIAVAVVGAYLWIADLALSHFVKNVLLNL